MEDVSNKVNESEGYFFCYNKIVSDFLYRKGIKFITIAIDKKTNREFSLFKVTEELQQALEERKSIKQEYINRNK